MDWSPVPVQQLQHICFETGFYKRCHCWQINKYVHNFGMILLSYLYDVLALHSYTMKTQFWHCNQLTIIIINKMFLICGNFVYHTKKLHSILETSKGKVTQKEGNRMKTKKGQNYPINHLLICYVWGPIQKTVSASDSVLSLLNIL